MNRVLTLPDKLEPGGQSRPSGLSVGEALKLLAALSRQAAAAGDCSEFAHDAVQAAAVLLQCSHFGWAEARREGRQVAAAICGNPRQSQAIGRRDFVMDSAGDEALFVEAMRSRRIVHVPDLSQAAQSDPRLTDLKIAAAAVVPLTASQETLGAVGVFDSHPRTFDSCELALLEALANLVSSTMIRCASQRELCEQRSLNQSLHDSMQSIMLVLDPDGSIVTANAACCELTSFTACELAGRSIFSALMLPEEFSEIKRAFARIRQRETTEQFDSYLLTRGGQRRRISWSITRLPGDDHSSASIIATGIDITDRCEAIERAVQAEGLAQSARQTLHELKHHVASREQSLGVASLEKRLPEGVEFDRRARTRADFRFPQRIAPLLGEEFPPPAAFKELQCRDISSRGFSFLSGAPLNCEKVVVAFGAPPSTVYLIAEVRHATEKLIDGRRQYLIGCRYTGRVTKGGA